MREIGLLQAFGAARRADAALMQPVAVGVQAVLDVVLAYFDAKLLRQPAGPLPGVDFQLQQLEITLIRRVAEQGVAGLVQQRPDRLAAFGVLFV
jgi:hypothetical protein